MRLVEGDDVKSRPAHLLQGRFQKLRRYLENTVGLESSRFLRPHMVQGEDGPDPARQWCNQTVCSRIVQRGQQQFEPSCRTPAHVARLCVLCVLAGRRRVIGLGCRNRGGCQHDGALSGPGRLIVNEFEVGDVKAEKITIPLAAFRTGDHDAGIDAALDGHEQVAHRVVRTGDHNVIVGLREPIKQHVDAIFVRDHGGAFCTGSCHDHMRGRVRKLPHDIRACGTSQQDIGEAKRRRQSELTGEAFAARGEIEENGLPALAGELPCQVGCRLLGTGGGARGVGRLYMAIERRLAPATDALIFESAYAAARYAAQVGTVGSTFRIIPNGLQPEDFHSPPTSPTAADFLFVGELRRLKGVDVMLEALARVQAVRPIRAVIVGDGPDAAAFKATASKLGLDRVVSFVGSLPATQAFRLGRALIVPSRAESFPYIVLEAAAAGLPIIATQVGGIPEIVAATDTPLIAPDDVVGLATAMLDVLADPEAARARAGRLRESVARRLTVCGMTDGVLDLYARFAAKA